MRPVRASNGTKSIATTIDVNAEWPISTSCGDGPFYATSSEFEVKDTSFSPYILSIDKVSGLQPLRKISLASPDMA
jgi:hypothetical protein